MGAWVFFLVSVIPLAILRADSTVEELEGGTVAHSSQKKA
jgi:hypothetical protein